MADYAEGVVEDPPSRYSRFPWEACVSNPRRWVVLRRYWNPATARRVASRLRGAPPLGGGWEFRSAQNHPEKGMSTLYAKYLGDM